MEKLALLTQIAYVPNHANGDLSHEDVEFGFIASDLSVGGNAYSCRYWSKRNPRELRTKSNSEKTYIWDIVVYDSHLQQEVIDAWDQIQKGNL